MLAMIKKPSWMKAGIFIVLVTIQAWSEHHYLLWYVIFSVWYLVYERKRVKHWLIDKKGWIYLGVIAVVLMLSVGLPYWPTIKMAVASDNQLVLGREQVLRFSADPFAYVMPASFHSIWGGVADGLFGQNFSNNIEESSLYIGLTTLLIVVFFSHQVRLRQKKFWLGVVGIFFVISLGPRLVLLGNNTGVPLPYEILDGWPIFSAVRTVARAAVMVNVAMVVLLALALRTQLKRMISVVALSVLIVTEFLFLPTPIQSAHLGQVYEEISKTKGERVVEIPAATNYVVASKSLAGSRLHNKTVVNNIALERAEGAGAYDEIRSMPGIRQLLYLRTGHIIEGRDEWLYQDMAETTADTLNWLDVGAIVIHPDSLTAKQEVAVIHLLEKRMGLERRTVEDSWLYEWREEIESDGVFIGRDAGWGEVVLDKDRGVVVADIASEAKLHLYNKNNEERLVQISWQMDEAELVNLVYETEAEVFEDWHDLTKVMRWQIRVSPGKAEIKFVNKGGKTVVIEDPRMQVMTDI